MKLQNLMKTGICMAVISLCFCSTPYTAEAEDTTWVQTFTFDSTEAHWGKFYFPTAGKSYRKVLMYTTLKCFPTVSGDNTYPCGEWDIQSTTEVYDHKNRFDSVLQTGSLFYYNGVNLKNGTTPDSVLYTLQPPYDLEQYYLYSRNVTQVLSQESWQTGSGTQTMPLSDSISRMQYIWTAAELAAAGASAGMLTGMRLQFTGSGSSLKWLHIKMRQVQHDSVAANTFIADSLQSVFYNHYPIAVPGWNAIQFTEPFLWDGSANLLVEISFDNTGLPATANALTGAPDAHPKGIYSNTPITCVGSSRYQRGFALGSLEGNMFTGTQPRTFEIWAMADSLNTGFFGSGREGINYGEFVFRKMQGNTWNFRNGHSTTVFQTPDPNRLWRHYAFTYDGNSLKVYQDGILAFQTSSITIRTRLHANFPLTIGNWFYHTPETPVQFAHFRIWDKALSQETIGEWLHRDVSAAHPDYAHLKANYPMDEGEGRLAYDISPNGLPPAEFRRRLWWQQVKAEHLFFRTEKSNWRPNIIWERNNQVFHTDSVLVTDTVYQPPVFIDMYDNPDGSYIIPDESALNPGVRTTVRAVWDSPWRYTYRNGIPIDSTPVIRDSVLRNRNTSWYSNTVMYEISRAITPYGINLDMGDGRTWIYDVTDYYPILQDTVDIKAGTSLELQDVRFAFIEGEPPAPVLHIGRPWFDGIITPSFRELAEDTKVQPVMVSLLPGTDELKVRARITGHGFGGSWPHCCEFYSNEHYIYAAGEKVESWRVWRNCGWNPLYPQGGTWTTDREGWCPGDMVHDKHIRIDPAKYLAGSAVELDYGINPVPPQYPSLGSGAYWMTLHTIQYGAPYRQNDAEIYEILKPSDQFYYSRMNPVCTYPEIILRNSGKKILTHAVIKYKVAGGQEATFTWSGNLGFLETDTVVLPVNDPGFWNGDGSNQFIAYVAGVNNTADEYAGNDTGRTDYLLPENYLADKIIVEFRTNNSPGHNELTLTDFSGTVLLNKSGLSPNTLYRDTMELPFGCYYLRLTDEGNDGLFFWANPAQGRGSLRLLNTMSATFPLKTFNPDFGAGIYHPFTVGFPLRVTDVSDEKRITVYPNPVRGTFNLHMEGYNGNAFIILSNVLGQKVMTDHISFENGAVERQYTIQLAPGMYLLHINDGTEVISKKLLIE